MSEQNAHDQQPNADKTEEIKRRLLEDPEFRARVEDDPLEVLLDAGLPEGTIGEFLREVGIEAEVTGYHFFPPKDGTGGFGPSSPQRGLPA